MGLQNVDPEFHEHVSCVTLVASAIKVRGVRT